MPRTKTRATDWNDTPEGRKYRNEYAAEHYDRLSLALPKGYKKIIDDAAESANLSRTALIVAAVDYYMQNCGKI